jgi:adenylate cyclase, class 2
VTIEVELKARLTDPIAVRERLDGFTEGVAEHYRDTYFDTPEGSLAARGYELRVRTIRRDDNDRHVLTYKEPAVDAATQSKPEHEIAVSDASVAARILTGLGYPETLAFTKDCVNYRLSHGGRRFLATLVTVPEIDGTFLEVETASVEADLGEALAELRRLMTMLGVDTAELTVDTYSDAVTSARRQEVRKTKPSAGNS